jgi:SAM-dependent methyltransferase
MKQDSAKRFSNRVQDYVRFRPGYPAELVATIGRVTGVGRGALVADIGSGTGISSRLLLDAGYRVCGVEPNREMRQAAEAGLADYPDFESVVGTAEASTLSGGAVDLIACGQAFHWFDHDAARSEWKRILRRGGSVALFWNSRRTDRTPFLRAYEQIVEDYGTDYREVNHRGLSRDLVAAFFGGRFRRFAFPNRQVVDREGLRGRLASSSYRPAPGQSRHDAMLGEIDRVFARHQEAGVVTIEYETELYVGRLA